MNHSGKKFCLTVKQTHQLVLSTNFDVAKFTLSKFKTLRQFNLEAFQDYTQFDDPGFNYFIFTMIRLTKLHNCTLFNFILEFCSCMMHFILYTCFFSFYCCCCFIAKVRLINFFETVQFGTSPSF